MSENWIVPCNVKFFDIIEHFKTHSSVIWHNAYSMHCGDKAYIYLGQPYSEIKYKCRVVNDNVDDAMLQENSYAIRPHKDKTQAIKKIKYAQLELIREYDDKEITLDDLRDNGLGQVQIQARTDMWVQRYLDRIDRKYRRKVS